MLADTWPSLLGLVHVSVAEQYCWSIFVLVSAAVQNTWGDYNPVTWGEALVWIFAMITVAVLFAVMVGFIVAIIRSSGRAEARYKDRMDNVMMSSTLHIDLFCLSFVMQRWLASMAIKVCCLLPCCGGLHFGYRQIKWQS